MRNIYIYIYIYILLNNKLTLVNIWSNSQLVTFMKSNSVDTQHPFLRSSPPRIAFRTSSSAHTSSRKDQNLCEKILL